MIGIIMSQAVISLRSGAVVSQISSNSKVIVISRSAWGQVLLRYQSWLVLVTIADLWGLVRTIISHLVKD